MDYRRVQGSGRTIRTATILGLVKPGEGGCSRVGLTVSRKVGGAVVRNRVKRLLREAVRKGYSRLDGLWDLVLIAHPSSAVAGASTISRDVGSIFQRIGTGRP